MRELDAIIAWRGKPDLIVSDHGATSSAFDHRTAPVYSSGSLKHRARLDGAETSRPFSGAGFRLTPGWGLIFASSWVDEVGQAVRAKPALRPGHTRLLGYVRGHFGTIAALRPAAVLPDSTAHFTGEDPQHVYTVQFASSELWGPDAESATVFIDLFETRGSAGRGHGHDDRRPDTPASTSHTPPGIGD